MEKLNQQIMMVMNIGVLVGLAVLIYELNQNSVLMRVQISQSRADAAVTATEATFNSEYLPAILVKVAAGEALSPDEAVRYDFWFRAQNRNQENVLHQYRAGMLGSMSVRGFAEEIVAPTKYARKIWEVQRSSYSSEYIILVDSVIQEVDLKCSQNALAGEEKDTSCK
jgi:hypothetical protein